MLGAYRLLAKASGPLIRHILERRLARGKEHPERINERKGIASLPRPEGKLIWIHAASVGESMSSLALIRRLVARDDSLNVLLTSGTVTSAKVVASRLPDRALHQFIPVDHPDWVAQFLDHWKPDVAIWLESELWPNLILGTYDRSVPLILANARLSTPSFRRWRRLGASARQIMNCFTVILPQTLGDADKFMALGAKDVRCLGNLKLAADPLNADPEAVNALKSGIGDRPCWLAASTHAGEEAIIADAHKQLKADHPGLLTVVVPRHPERLDAVLTDLRQAASNIAVRSKNDVITNETEIYIGDTLGEMGLFYAALPISLVCGSLVEKIGGHNPIEPAQLGSAVMFGRHMANFRDIERDMLAVDAATRVGDASDIAAKVGRLLANRKAREEAARQALYYARQGDRILDDILDTVTPHIDGAREASHG